MSPLTRVAVSIGALLVAGDAFAAPDTKECIAAFDKGQR